MLLAFVLLLSVNGQIEILDYNLSGSDCVERMIELQNPNLSCEFQQ